jgi:hypothetical protein
LTHHAKALQGWQQTQSTWLALLLYYSAFYMDGNPVAPSSPHISFGTENLRTCFVDYVFIDSLIMPAALLPSCQMFVMEVVASGTNSMGVCTLHTFLM